MLRGISLILIFFFGFLIQFSNLKFWIENRTEIFEPNYSIFPKKTYQTEPVIF